LTYAPYSRCTATAYTPLGKAVFSRYSATALLRVVLFAAIAVALYFCQTVILSPEKIFSPAIAVKTAF
jgi:hypothetical protein